MYVVPPGELLFVLTAHSSSRSSRLLYASNNVTLFFVGVKLVYSAGGSPNATPVTSVVMIYGMTTCCRLLWKQRNLVNTTACSFLLVGAKSKYKT